MSLSCQSAYSMYVLQCMECFAVIFVVCSRFISAALRYGWTACKMATLAANHWTVNKTVASVVSSICYRWRLKALLWVHHLLPSLQLMEPKKSRFRQICGCLGGVEYISASSSKNAHYFSLKWNNENQQTCFGTREMSCWDHNIGNKENKKKSTDFTFKDRSQN